MGEIDEWEHDALLQLEALIDERCRAAVEERDREWSQALLPGCTVGWVREKLKQPGFAAGVLTEEKTIAIEEAVAEEREECAKVVEDMASSCEKWADGAPLRIAVKAIRARGERGDG